jgi:hypothetical protein
MKRDPQELRILKMSLAAVTDFNIAVERVNHKQLRELVEKHTVWSDSGRTLKNFGPYVFGLKVAGVFAHPPRRPLRHVSMHLRNFQDLGIVVLLSLTSESAQAVRKFLARDKDIKSQIRAAWKLYFNDEEIKAIKEMAFLWERVVSLAEAHSEGVVMVMFTALASQGFPSQARDRKRSKRRRET